MFEIKTVSLSLIYLFIFVVFSNSTTKSEELLTEVRNGNVVDNFSIEELLIQDSTFIPDAKLEDVTYHSGWIFEKGPGLTPDGSADRNYDTSFNKGESRFICWEMSIEHKADPSHRNMDFVFKLFDEDGNKLTESISDSWVPAGQEITDHSACWGFPYPNNWSPGRYYFEVVPQAVDEASRKQKANRIEFEVI